ncbi:MAG: type II CAAX endopeptidase family protein [Lachnospiraceae bacterium]|nr:type II CAAX endopeptidase family protein [Lachnospiraceae bacterium]
MKRMYAVDANRVFLLSVLTSQLFVFLISGIGVRDTMLLQFLLEVFMTLPGICYLAMQGQSVKKSLGINRLSGIEWLLLIPLALCVDKIAEFINVVSQLFTPNLVGNHMMELILKYPFVLAFFVIAVTPAVCEELIYRGVLYRGYRKTGVWVAVILTAFLFGIMHMNLNQFSYAFVLGLLFALINELTGSVVPSVCLHLYVNGRSVVLLYAAVNYLKGLREQYIVAEAAGDKGLMERLLDSAHGVPIESEQWLEEYMNMGSGTLTENIRMLLPTFLVALIGAFLILLFLYRKRKDRAEELTAGKMYEAEGEAGSKRNKVVSPTLLIGMMICIVFMFLK